MTAYPLFCKVREVTLDDGEIVRALVPDNKISEETLSKVWLGRTVAVTTETARNYDQLKLLYAMADKIAQNTERFTDKDHVIRELKLNTGHVEREQINIPGLGIVFREWPASIAYESMKQEEWQPWLDKALAYVRSDIWPGMPAGVIKDEVTTMLGDDLFAKPKKSGAETPANREKARAV
jgi:hypothetical protein